MWDDFCKNADQYVDQNYEMWKASQGYSTEEPKLECQVVLDQYNHETFLVDNNVSPTPCALDIPYHRMGKTKQIGRGVVYPGRTIHSSIIPNECTEVEILLVCLNHLDYEVLSICIN